MNIPQDTYELAMFISITGRHDKPRKVSTVALNRLINYWAIRTPMSRHRIMSIIRDDIRNDWPIGFRKWGWGGGVHQRR